MRCGTGICSVCLLHHQWWWYENTWSVGNRCSGSGKRPSRVTPCNVVPHQGEAALSTSGLSSGDVVSASLPLPKWYVPQYSEESSPGMQRAGSQEASISFSVWWHGMTTPHGAACFILVPAALGGQCEVGRDGIWSQL